MDEHDIARVIKAYDQAARRCEEGGLDGIETLAAGHIIGQFLSPKTNHRTDRFGGSLENRVRFALMVHEEIRRNVSDGFIVGMRYVVDEGIDGELSAEECLAAAQILEREGAVDFFNALFGSMDTSRSLSEEVFPGMGMPAAPWVAAVGLFKRAVNLPVFHAAKLSDMASARFAVSEGHVDMAGLTRPHITDPHMVAKLMRGEEHRIRPCVGDVLIWDNTGRHPALLAAQVAQAEGANVRLTTIDVNIGQDLVYPESTRWHKEFAKSGLRPEGNLRLTGVTRKGNKLEATLMNELTHDIERQIYDQVIVEMGTIPMNELFDELRGQSANDGVTDLHALKNLEPQPRRGKGYELHRIGDAQSSRNIHAAVYDALRLCSVA
ncbi:hypothetical protein [uncultured Roseovarius sp.]|uniref:oxidoreductase n=1 Tax=uncultured Roseovarius sp. TaxID=293344 RepID=UPI0025D936B1|nr:hypothetical protein [uncultured Roseovarius sp.]